MMKAKGICVETVSENRAFGGVQGVYRHASKVCHCDMAFGLFLPPQAAFRDVPVVWFLSGLTCTHANAMEKAGAQAYAARHGVAVCFPDTSPRGEGVGDDEAYDLGQGAGFYVDATQTPWKPHFQMWRYLAEELPTLIQRNFPIDEARQGITGHSMGGHGALTLAMGLPGRFSSVSAFAPIAHPSASEWGQKQLGAYLGEETSAWQKHDATLQMRSVGLEAPVLIDQGSKDQFLDLLKPEALAEAMAARRQPGSFRMQKGYDHSYYFVASFMEDHMSFHAKHLTS